MTVVGHAIYYFKIFSILYISIIGIFGLDWTYLFSWWPTDHIKKYDLLSIPVHTSSTSVKLNNKLIVMIIIIIINVHFTHIGTSNFQGICYLY